MELVLRGGGRRRTGAEDEFEQKVRVARVAMVVCDMWADYWCSTLNAHVEELAPRIAEAVERARESGAVIVHAPSWLIGDFYDDYPQRQRALALPGAPESGQRRPDAQLPESLQGGSCPDFPPCAYDGWRPRRQHPAIRIAPGDWLISDDPDDLLFRVLAVEPVDIVLVAGIHTNMCVLEQPFGVRELVRREFDCAVVRDLTEAIDWSTTEQVVEWIEENLCYSIDSSSIRGPDRSLASRPGR